VPLHRVRRFANTIVVVAAAGVAGSSVDELREGFEREVCRVAWGCRLGDGEGG